MEKIIVKKTLLIFVSVFILILIGATVFSKYLYPVFSFTDPDRWRIDGGSLSKIETNLAFTGNEQSTNIYAEFYFANPVNLDLINQDGFFFRAIIMTPAVKDLTFRLISDNNPQNYAEWTVNQESERLGIDINRLASWQNYRLPVAWSAERHFNPQKITAFSVSYHFGQASGSPEFMISTPVIFKKLTIPCAFFAKDPRIKNLYFSYISNTQLPVLKINISQKDLDNLSSNLPDSGRDPKKANFTDENNQKYNVEIHYRGDLPIHYKFIKKSWRIIFPPDSLYHNFHQINLMVPKNNHYGTQIPYLFSKEMRLLAPQTQAVRLLVNEVDMGSYDLVEQVDDQFLANRNFSKGLLYYGEADSSQDIQGLAPLFESQKRWNLKQQLNTDVPSANDPLGKLLSITALPQNLFNNQIDTILDTDAYLRWYVIYNLFNSIHNDNIHNLKLFYDQNRLKFIPIVWDVNPNSAVDYLLEPFPKNFANNLLTYKLFQEPRFALARDRYFYFYGKKLITPKRLQQEMNSATSKTKLDFINDRYTLPSKIKYYDQSAQDFESRINNHIKDVLNQIEKPNISICQQNTNHIKLVINSNNPISINGQILLPNYDSIVSPDYLYQGGISHSFQLRVKPTSYVLLSSVDIVNPITDQILYSPDVTKPEKCDR